MGTSTSSKKIQDIKKNLKTEIEKHALEKL